MQAAGHLVGAVVEFASGMQLGQDDVDGRPAGVVHLHRNAAAVIGHLDPAVFEQPHTDRSGVTGHRFVH